MKKKILIVGNTPKAYALAKKLSEKHDIYITPSSDTLKEFTTCLDIREDNINELLEFVMENEIDMTIAVSEIAIKSDIASKFSGNNQPVFAPSANASELIYNKTYAKKTLYKLRVPTPKFGIFEKLNLANDYMKNQKIPFVLKTNDNNSATIATSLNVAKNIAESVFAQKNQKLIIEDYIYGMPFSFYAITDGYKAIPIGSSLSYKHSLEGDGGQLTSGMGACTPNYKLSMDNEYYLLENVIYPTLEYLESCNNPYIGIIGVNGILIDEGKISVLGWQNFTQDFDTDGILSQIEDDLYSLFESCIVGSFSDEVDIINQNNNQAVSVVLTCKSIKQENIIEGLNNLDENTLISFYPSVSKNKYLELEAKQGSVMVITSCASSVSKAKENVYEEASNIDYNSIFYRKDICSLNN